MAYKKVYDNNFEDLTKILPMNDSIFMAKLKTKGLLEGDISEQIDQKVTKADKAKYFLQNVIESGFVVDDTEKFYKFLTVMEKSEHSKKSKKDEIRIIRYVYIICVKTLYVCIFTHLCKNSCKVLIVQPIF